MSRRGFGLLATPMLVVALAGCGGSSTAGGGGPTPTPSIPAGAKQVDIVSDPNNVGAYQPGSLNVKVGDTVAWVWKDQGNPHTVTADDNSFNSDPDGTGHNAGFVYTRQFSTAGTFKYHCTLHSGMMGTIVVSAS